MNVLSLFAGIGGLELGLERAGMTVVGQVEIDPFCQQVLATHWPEVPRHDDVRTALDWWRLEPRPHVDVIAGGFPCQPASLAGKRLGADDDRWLWPAMADLIGDLRPSWVVWENVPGLLTRGLEHVHADLVRLGYRHRVGRTTACAVGRPHLRRRLFGVAHTHRLDGRQGLGPGHRRPIPDQHRPAGPPAHPIHGLLEAAREGSGVAHGIPEELDRARVRALGNAIVPDIAEHIGRLITGTRHEASAALPRPATAPTRGPATENPS